MSCPVHFLISLDKQSCLLYKMIRPYATPEDELQIECMIKLKGPKNRNISSNVDDAYLYVVPKEYGVAQLFERTIATRE